MIFLRISYLTIFSATKFAKHGQIWYLARILGWSKCGRVGYPWKGHAKCSSDALTPDQYDPQSKVITEPTLFKALLPPRPPPPLFWTFGRFFLTDWETLCLFMSILCKFYANLMSNWCLNAFMQSVIVLNVGLTPAPSLFLNKTAE